MSYYFMFVGFTAAVIAVKQFGVCTEILAQPRDHLLCLLQHIQIYINHCHGSRIALTQLSIQSMVSLREDIFYLVAISSQRSDYRWSVRRHHQQNIGKECVYPVTNLIKFGGVLCGQWMKVVFHMLLARFVYAA